VSVYHVALAGRVQRYSPIYYPDSHANSAIVPTGLRLTERCHGAVRVSFPHTHTHTHTRTHTHTHIYAHAARTHSRGRAHTYKHTHGSATHRYVSSSRRIQRSLRIVVLRGRDFRGHCILVTRYYTIGRDRRRLRCTAPSRV